MKRTILSLFLLVTISTVSSAATWDYFFHARKVGLKLGATTTSPEWMFKPTFTIDATSIRPGTHPGVQTDESFLSAAGPALTLQHTILQPDGTNYADYSGNIALLLTGQTNNGPSIVPAVAVTAGILNNIVNVGGGYDLQTRDDGLSRFFVLVSLGVNLTNN
jgi:hypothetical protein